MLRPATRDSWVVIAPAEDVPGEWVAHCLDVNVMSQGRSLAHALDMIVEAVDLVVAEDRAAGLDPFDRKASPEEWAEFADHMRHATLTTFEALVVESDGAPPVWVAAQVVIPGAADFTSSTPRRVDGRGTLPVGRAAQAVVQHAGASA